MRRDREAVFERYCLKKCSSLCVPAFVAANCDKKLPPSPPAPVARVSHGAAISAISAGKGLIRGCLLCGMGREKIRFRFRAGVVGLPPRGEAGRPDHPN
jgi:hypothetical protein